MKPQVTILLEEYNNLLEIKSNSKDINQEHAKEFAEWLVNIARNPTPHFMMSPIMQENYNQFIVSKL